VYSFIAFLRQSCLL